MKGAYYNEHDPGAARWLRELIHEGLIADGTVDERSIKDVEPADLRGFAQCHFFAGIGVWSYALRLAGWPDDEPVWTGSCPCQPFSSAGNQLGFADPRHLWPEWLRLIGERRPNRIFGEQVDSADAWVDLVSADLESLGYAIGSPDLPAAGFGGGHIRQRFFWVADADNAEWWTERAPWHDGEWPKTGRVQGDRHPRHGSASRGLAYADGGIAGDGGVQSGGKHRQLAAHGSLVDGVGDACGDRSTAHARNDGEVCGVQEAKRQPEHSAAVLGRPGCALGVVDATDGRLRMGSGGVSYLYQPDRSGDVDWLLCRDAFWRPVEPGTCPLVDEAPARMGRLRGYGNAIDAQTAADFIAAFRECAPSFARAAA